MSTLIQTYLSDTSIDVEKRREVSRRLNAGEVQPQQMEQMISQKYGEKYGGAKKTTGFVEQYRQGAENILGGVANAGARAAAETTRGLGNVVGTGLEVLGNVDPTQIANRFISGDPNAKGVLSSVGGGIKGGAEYLAGSAEQVQEKINPMAQDQASSFIGKGLGMVGASVPAMISGGAVANKLGQGLAGFLGASGAGTTAGVAAQEGRLPNPVEYATGLGIDTLFGGISRGLRTLGKAELERTVPLTPIERGRLNKRGIDLGEALVQDIGFTPSKKSFVKQTTKRIKEYGDQISQLLQPAKNSGVEYRGADLMKNVETKIQSYLDNLIKKAPVSQKNEIIKGAKDEIEAIKNEIGDIIFNPEDILMKKKYFDKKINYDKLNPVNNAKEAVNKAVADNARKILDDINPKITSIHEKMSPLIEARRVALKKGSYSQNLTDAIALMEGFGRAGASPEGVIKNMVEAIALKRMLNSLPFRTGVGVGAYKLGKAADSPNMRALLKTYAVPQRTQEY